MANPAKPALHWPLAALLLATLVIRTSALWVQRANLDQDPDAYREIAENLLRHGDFALGHGENEIRPTAYRPPLYPLVLSNLSTADCRDISLPKVAALHVILGLATVWLTLLTARCLLGPGQRLGTTSTFAPLLAGLLVACDPILLNQQSLVMTETLATFLAILSLWCLTRYCAHACWFNAALAGSAIGLAILTRPAFLPWLGLLVSAVVILPGPIGHSMSRRAINTLIVALTAACMLSPWAIRNDRLFGKPIVTTTHGGYTLYLGNNPSFYKHLLHSKSDLPWSAETQAPQSTSSPEFVFVERLSSSEMELDQQCYTLAKQAIRGQPRAFVLACLYRITQLWSPLPHKLTAGESLARRVLRYATCAWYLAVYALAAASVWKLRWNLLKPPWLYAVLLFLAFTAVHTFYWTNLRMRAPLMPVVALVAAAAALPAAKSLRSPAPTLQPPASDR